MRGCRDSRSQDSLTLGSELLDEAFDHVDGRSANTSFARAELTEDDLLVLGFHGASSWEGAACRPAGNLLNRETWQDPRRHRSAEAHAADLVGTPLMRNPEFLLGIGSPFLLQAPVWSPGSILDTRAPSRAIHNEDRSAMDMLLSVGESLDAACARERMLQGEGRSRDFGAVDSNSDFDATAFNSSATRGRGSRGGGRGSRGGRGSGTGRGGGAGRGGRGRGAARAAQQQPNEEYDTQTQELLDLLEEGLKADNAFATGLAPAAQGPLAPTQGKNKQCAEQEKSTTRCCPQQSADAGYSEFRLQEHGAVKARGPEKSEHESIALDAGRMNQETAAGAALQRHSVSPSRQAESSTCGDGERAIAVKDGGTQRKREKGGVSDKESAGRVGGLKAEASHEGATSKRESQVDEAGDAKKRRLGKEGNNERGKGGEKRNEGEGKVISKAMSKGAEDGAEEVEGLRVKGKGSQTGKTEKENKETAEGGAKSTIQVPPTAEGASAIDKARRVEDKDNRDNKGVDNKSGSSKKAERAGEGERERAKERDGGGNKRTQKEKKGKGETAEQDCRGADSRAAADDTEAEKALQAVSAGKKKEEEKGKKAQERKKEEEKGKKTQEQTKEEEKGKKAQEWPGPGPEKRSKRENDTREKEKTDDDKRSKQEPPQNLLHNHHSAAERHQSNNPTRVSPVAPAAKGESERKAFTKDGHAVFAGEPLQLSKKSKEGSIRWVGPPLGKHAGGLRYKGVIFNDWYVEEGCQVQLHSDEGPTPYLARVEYLWEHASTAEPMVTCRWFYRREDVPSKVFDKSAKGGVRSNCWTVRKGGGRPKEVLDNEVFLSNVMDDNTVETIIGLCEVYVGKKIYGDCASSSEEKNGNDKEEQAGSGAGSRRSGGESDSKRKGKDEVGGEVNEKKEMKSAAAAQHIAAVTMEKFVCRMSYSPVEGTIRKLTSDENRMGLRSNGASARSIAYTEAFRKWGRYQLLSLLADQSPSDSQGCGAGATNRQQGERGDAVLQDGAVGAGGGGGDGRLVRIKLKMRGKEELRGEVLTWESSAVLGRYWKQVLSGDLYADLASSSTRKAASGIRSSSSTQNSNSPSTQKNREGEAGIPGASSRHSWSTTGNLCAGPLSPGKASTTPQFLSKILKIPRLSDKLMPKPVDAKDENLLDGVNGGGAALESSTGEVLPRGCRGKVTGTKRSRNEEEQVRVPREQDSTASVEEPTAPVEETGPNSTAQHHDARSPMPEQPRARSPTPNLVKPDMANASKTVGVAGVNGMHRDVNGMHRDADAHGRASRARGAKPNTLAMTDAKPKDNVTQRADVEESLSGSSTEPSEAGKLEEEGGRLKNRKLMIVPHAGSEEDDKAGENAQNQSEVRAAGWTEGRREQDMARPSGEGVAETDGDPGDFEWVGDMLRNEEGRRYYSSLRTPAGVEVPLGSTILVYAPRGQPPFLAQVEAMWENEGDKLKQYRCRWFFRPNQAFQASALQEVQQLQHPREVFYSDELDVNYVNTIHGRTIVVHRDTLPPDFNLDSLRVGDHFFYRSKYDRKTRHFVPVEPPHGARNRMTVGGQGLCGKGGGARHDVREGQADVCAVHAAVLAGDISILLQNSRVE